MKRSDLLVLCTAVTIVGIEVSASGQNTMTSLCCDSLLVTSTRGGSHRYAPDQDYTHRFRWQQFIAPVALAGVGSIPLYCGKVNGWDVELQHALVGSCALHIDDYIQYAPMVAVYGLNLCGLKGRHNFRDRTMLLATSYLIMGVSVNGLKHSVRRLRPNGLSHTSFPSGHTATAFMAAEFLRMEYKDSAPWIGYVGYAVASGVGVLRVYNNAHYLSDVLAGAGIGILSVRIAYWIYPSIQRLLFGRRCNSCAFMVTPYYDTMSSALGVGCFMRF